MEGVWEEPKSRGEDTRPGGQVGRAREVKRNPTHQWDLVTEQIWEVSEESRRITRSLGWVTGQCGVLDQGSRCRRRELWGRIGRFACAPCEVSMGGAIDTPSPGRAWAVVVAVGEDMNNPDNEHALHPNLLFLARPLALQSLFSLKYFHFFVGSFCPPTIVRNQGNEQTNVLIN